MNPKELEQQEKLQAAAERAERERLPAGDPQVDAYRLVLRALKQPLPIALPADFAQQVARTLHMREEGVGLEQWLTNILLLIMAIGAAIFALPSLASVLAQVLRTTAGQSIPWPSIGVAAFAMAAAWLADVAVESKKRTRA